MVKPGQIWENGVKAVKLQKADSGILAITYDINENRSLQFSHSNVYDEKEVFSYVTRLGCELTDKHLALGG